MSLTSGDSADIKQLMESVPSSHTTEINKHFDEVNKRLDYMDRRFDENEEVQNEILNAIGTNLNRHSERLDDCEYRLKKLEHGVA